MAALYFITVFTLFLLASNAEEITVKPGDDVTLQCQSPTDATITLLEWSRPDLKKDGYVFFFRENRPYDSFQHPSFRGRVQLKDPEMKDGDVSVILKNVTINDTGTYECRVSVIGKRLELINTTYLKVEDSGHTAGNTWTEGHKDGGDKDEGKKEAGNLGLTVGLPVAAVLLLVGVIVVCVIYRKHKQRPDQQVHYIAAVPQQV
ncbi:coxsackievirus and adenovirus receptor-like [Thunnus maccoyii]|uniref:coxsackievirus and adenovirus receptor-like n=1 Tax=Thunnus maccoyii TaxID=8240 RepID=UPI001C4AF74F|nr:coxsackievirus and adenovirus receptor-like [Thunnus maccoyii]